MNAKLTLYLDKSIVEEAKIYAKSNKLSLSKLIENYLYSLTCKNTKDPEISILVKNMTGIFSENELDTRTNYTDYLNQKYK